MLPEHWRHASAGRRVPAVFIALYLESGPAGLVTLRMQVHLGVLPPTSWAAKPSKAGTVWLGWIWRAL